MRVSVVLRVLFGVLALGLLNVFWLMMSWAAASKTGLLDVKALVASEALGLGLQAFVVSMFFVIFANEFEAWITSWRKP